MAEGRPVRNNQYAAAPAVEASAAAVEAAAAAVEAAAVGGGGG